MVTKLEIFLLTNIFIILVESKPSVLRLKLPLHPTPLNEHECQLPLERQEFQLLLRWADRTAYKRRPASESNFPALLQYYTHYSDAAISNAKINTKVRYGNSAHIGDGYRQQHCI